MKNLISLSILMLAGTLFLDASSQAQSLEMSLSSGFIGISKNSTQYDLSPGIQYQLLPSVTWLTIGGEVGYQKISHDLGSTKNFVVLAGPTFNIGPFNRDAVFVSIGFAYKNGSSDVASSGVDDPNGTGYYFLVGKRIPLGTNWCFRPSLGVESTGTSGMVFRPLAVGYYF
jgi:hypothetical protein